MSMPYSYGDAIGWNEAAPLVLEQPPIGQRPSARGFPRPAQSGNAHPSTPPPIRVHSRLSPLPSANGAA